MVAAAEELPCSTIMEHAATNIYEVDPLWDPRWAALVETHRGASVFHRTNWLRALQTTYTYFQMLSLRGRTGRTVVPRVVGRSGIVSS